MPLVAARGPAVPGLAVAVVLALSWRATTRSWRLWSWQLPLEAVYCLAHSGPRKRSECFSGHHGWSAPSCAGAACRPFGG